ncbi:MAG: hypothetical protein JWN61_1937 [Pseudonocardiales bacterium]|nr:hypothetical protein [Jatrophihabitantaceae bacterium]MCW2603802.1 hypothetical protein [Pseudonocardiales bacterium]
MSLVSTYPTQLEFRGGLHIARWRPLVQWLLAIPHLLIVNVLGSLRQVLTLIAFFAVLFTRRIPRPLFDAIAMTLRYEWRVTSYALFLHEDYPPFDFSPAADDDGADPHTTVTFTYPGEMARWKPLYKWVLAIPHYFVLLVLAIAAVAVVIAGVFAVLFTANYPVRMRDFLVAASRYSVRVQSYVGLLSDEYPPFSIKG